MHFISSQKNRPEDLGLREIFGTVFIAQALAFQWTLHFST
ncbi:hypothetical protein HMPREF7215_2522 [Pyramidobacter piscolens W5455]|uniref:Uncharacterized protein n=1 Tax=Pyramidobacter piscolens W5455 TaxID=352165 RepID=A0ABP2HW41_9BACT|nr:hypothetical protein HMPREF7215_2522 [Pyramidobacter piscolens W5455]